MKKEVDTIMGQKKKLTLEEILTIPDEQLMEYALTRDKKKKKNKTKPYYN